MTDKKSKRAIFEDGARKYYYSDILEALRKVGIRKGDAIFVHSDVAKFGKLADIRDRGEFLDLMLAALKEAVGAKGTIIMPTFSYSFTKKEVYDPDKTPSTVGVLTEHFRKQPGVKRTEHPIFSAAAWGGEKEYFGHDSAKDCFGQGTIFGKIYKKNAKIVFFGAFFESCTFIHSLEQLFGAPYRFNKSFTGKISVGGKVREETCDYFVRSLDGSANPEFSVFEAHLVKNGFIKRAKLGSGEILAVSSRKLGIEAWKMFRKDNYFLSNSKNRRKYA